MRKEIPSNQTQPFTKMESKLTPTPGLTEIGILFDTTENALIFLKELVEEAQTQTTLQNKEWPTSIYWDNKELHFQVFSNIWGTQSRYYIEEIYFHTQGILQHQGWSLNPR